MKDEILKYIKGGLIVSCQPDEIGLFSRVDFMVEFARASELGGAVGIRAEGFETIKAIKNVVRIPVIGLIKKKSHRDNGVIITPDFEAVEKLVEAGADIIAVEATRRDGRFEFFKEVRDSYKDLILMADVSTYEEGIKSAELGADIIATTLSGYTPYTKNLLGKYEPDFELVENLAKNLDVPIVAEGRIWTVEQAVKMFELGAYAIVIGTAITRPRLIVQRFVEFISMRSK